MDCLNDFLFSEKYCFYRNAAAILGTLVILRFFLYHFCNMMSGFRAFFLAPMGLGRMNLRKYGSWAVVTGASEGIGRGYALELAKRGLNVVLMSRSEEKLNKVATEIKEQYGRETRVVPVDFSGGLDIYTMISDHIKDLDVGVLVNNVGFSVEYPNYMDKIPAERLYKIVQLNCQPVVQMSRLLLPKMVAKGGGVIVNLSSAASYFSAPQSFVYSATKIYVTYVSDGLRKEYGSKGIVVQNVTPFYVATAMSGIRRTSFGVPSGTAYSKAAVATIGIQNDTFGCFSHALQGYVVSRLPGRFLDHFISNASDAVRAKFLRKQAKNKDN